MADDADFAAEYQQNDIDRAIKNVLKNVKPTSKKIEMRDCEECGNPIPLARIAASNSDYCVECQRAIELEEKQYKRVVL